MSQSEITKPVRIAFIQARWHSAIVDEARLAFIENITALSGSQARVDVIDVPGALEIPLIGQKLARSGNYDAIVGAAFVVNGGIYRHDFVSSSVIDGIMRVALDEGVPFLSVVLTPHNFQESPELTAFFVDHFKIKGKEAASACAGILAALDGVK